MYLETFFNPDLFSQKMRVGNPVSRKQGPAWKTPKSGDDDDDDNVSGVNRVSGTPALEKSFLVLFITHLENEPHYTNVHRSEMKQASCTNPADPKPKETTSADKEASRRLETHHLVLWFSRRLQFTGPALISCSHTVDRVGCPVTRLLF